MEGEEEEVIYADIFTVASAIIPRGIFARTRGVTLCPPSRRCPDAAVRDKAGIISPSSENHDD